jgi:hypothetical protein
MCSWITERAPIKGRAKGVPVWTPVARVSVYYDHPVSLPLDHALIIDFAAASGPPEARVGVELSAESARALVCAIEAALATGEAHAGHG